MWDSASQESWSKHTSFFAFPKSANKAGEIRYYVDSAKSPDRHRVLSYDDVDRKIGGDSGWVEVMQFWVFKEPKTMTIPFTVLFASDSTTPYRSQIVRGDNVGVVGWSIHSVFWTYELPGSPRE